MDDTRRDMARGTVKDERHVFGPRPLAALLPAVTRAAFRARPAATAHVLSDWPQIVGPAIAAVSAPRRLVTGTLTIGCAGPVAMELQHLAPQLIARVNAHAGRAVVTRIKLVQDGGSAPARPAPRPRAEPSEAAVAKVEKKVAGLPEGDLRDALASLGRAVLTKSGTASEN